MVEPITLDDVRSQVRADEDVHDDDYMLEAMIVPARRACEKFTGISLASNASPLADPDDVKVIGQAMLLIIAHWYSNREAVTISTLAQVPISAAWLLGTIRNRSL